ncbi:hypothetical protein QEN19_000889 [Hanseniaspora menglaensis]
MPAIASKAQIDLCRVKDNEIISKINDKIEELVLLLPKRVRELMIKQNKQMVKQMGLFFYFFKTLTEVRSSTLGESYAGLQPSKVKNTIYLCYLLFQNSFLKLKLSTNYSNLFTHIKDCCEIIQNLFDFKIFQRLSVLEEPELEVNSHFETIGQFQLVKMISKVCFKLYNKKYSDKSIDFKSNESLLIYENNECLLCTSDHTTNPSVGKCGHIFCFDCYIKWASKNLSCPLCRFKIHPREIVPLRN